MHYSYIDKTRLTYAWRNKNVNIGISKNQKVYFHFWKHTANKLLSIEFRGPVVLIVRHPR